MSFMGISFSKESCLSENSVKKSPNILYVAIDDLNDWVSYLGGHPQARTPNIDRLVKKANKRTIIIFMSGGMDSRLILSKLVEKHKHIPVEIEIATFTSWK